MTSKYGVFRSEEKTIMPNTTPLHPPHRGQPYQEVLSQLSKARAVERYLEIGVRGGKTFANVFCDAAVGVDPEYLLNSNIMLNKKKAFLFQMTSDVFFRSVDLKKYLEGPPDLAFLDGMHKFEYLLRDFMYVESASERHSLIAMHDCLPLNEAMTNRNEITAKQLSVGTNYENWWTGDVWKLIPILKKYRPDLRLVAVNAPPTGLLFVTNLNPNSRVLNEEYLNIVSEFSPGSNWDHKLTELYEMTEVVPTEALLNDSEQSLYLRM